MSRTVFLAAASSIALCAGAWAGALPTAASAAGFHAFPGAGKILYNQHSNNSGVGVVCENFSSTYSNYDCAAADDFIVPKGKTWMITEVDVTGVYYNGSGPASSEDVVFYANHNGVPGKALKGATYTKLAGSDDDGSFAIVLPKKLALDPGHYWVSVVPNVDFAIAGEWGWEGNSVIHNDSAVFEGYGCTGKTWCSLNGDLMFDLRGRSKRE